MDVAPRTLARALPWLAAFLGLEGIVALTPAFTGTEIRGSTCMGALIHVPEIALLLGFALGVGVMTSGGATRIACQRLLYGGFASIAAVGVGRFVDVDIEVGASRVWLFLHVGATALIAVAAPGLWGVALAREQDLSSARIVRVGRIFAGIAFAGAGMVAVSELALLLQQNPLAHLSRAGLGLVAASATLLGGRLLVLWCAVDTWRPAPDEGVLRDRARQVQRRMIPASLLGLGSAVMTGFFWPTEAHGVGGYVANTPMVLWHGVVQLTLAVLVAILLAIALEPETISYQPRMKGPSFPEPPPPPPEDRGPIDVP